MCTWAYEALKAERGAATLDFRRFHDRFARCFSHKGARCRNGEPCNGRSPGNCKRFKGAEILDQSAHDYLCPGPTKCTKLHWDEASYRSITRARAVSIEATGDNLLRYCSASAQTMSVSHVWSHGQGGRPEKKTRDGQTGGMNICLHKRFASIAKEKFGCESYWMDTPCIPEDHALRRESIACINDIFTTSKATLVCDIDLMDIDISSIMQEGTTASTIEIQESILATLLVCDWNVRAWTLLEAFRGRKNIYILCKHNAVISLKQILDSVCRHGSIDIATLYLTAQHLIPSLIHPPNSGRSHHPISLGFISLEEAGSLLSHRHASRDSDDIVIWSLLFSGKACHSAEAMWRSKIPGQELENLDINTGFLVSSAPRITGHPGLSWAPSCPAVHLTDEQERDGLTAYLAFDGGGTSLASVAPFGLEAAWLIHRFPGGKSETAQTWPGLAAIVDKNLSDYLWGALLRPMAMNRWGETEPEKYRGNARGSLLVVCGSDDQNGAFWEWKGVWDWAGNPLPEFRKELVLIA